MSANIRETIIGVGKVAQTDLATINGESDIIRWNKLNASLADVSLQTESDANEIGKGHEFATANFKTAWNTGVSMEKYLSSELAGWLFAFGLGTSTATSPATGAYKHTATPRNPVTGGIELPSFTYVEQIRPGGSAVLDRALVGNVIDSFTISLGTGPGRSNSRATANAIGSGKIVEPSDIEIPAATAEHQLTAASAGITINGTNYVSAKSIVSLEFTWNNNHRTDSGYYPGSGFQTSGDPDSGQLRGRLEYGDRSCSLRFTARFANGSSELTKLKAQTEGTAVFTMQGALITGSTYHDMSITLHRVVFSEVRVADTDGIVTVDVTCNALYHSSNGLLTAYATNGIALMGAES